MTSRKKLGKSLNLEIDLIPESNSNRPGVSTNPEYITIHNTDNTKKGADAIAHAKYIKGQDAQNRQVSWHYTVDDRVCVKHLPINEKGWHAATADGNNKSIGIEICMNEGIDQSAANTKAATLVAILMYDLSLTLDRVVTHHHWSGKNCPRLLLSDGQPGKKWHKFLEEVNEIYQSIEPQEDLIAKIFAGGDDQLSQWHDSHGPEEGITAQPSSCCLPVVPVRQLEQNLNPHRESLVRYMEKKWVNGTVLHYCFLDNPSNWRGDNTQKQAVRDAFAEWKNLGIGLKFEEVSDRNQAEIRIGFEGLSTNTGGSWSYVGRDSIDYAPNPNERTMNFGWDLTTSYGHDTALHEIGHALGFPHEHQNPNAGIVWNEQAVYDYFGGPPNNWTRETTYHNIIRKISSAEVEGSGWDKDSIMHYQIAAGLIKSPSGYQNRPLIPASGLSAVDVEEVKKFYPGSTPTPVQLKPYLSVLVDIEPGQQLDFIIRPEISREYTIQTIGYVDTVIVLFEDVNGNQTYIDGDDDSGWSRNAEIRTRLMQGKTYYLKLRLYSASATGQGAVIVW